MDIKAKIEEIVKKLTASETLKSQFTKSPVATVEKLLGIDLPDEQVKKIVEGVKAKLSLNTVGDKVGDAVDALKGILGGN